MSEMHNPYVRPTRPEAALELALELDAPQAAASAAPHRWPTPPSIDHAGFVAATLSGPATACEVLGLNGHQLTGQLLAFSVPQATVQLLVPPARKPMTLRFDQFKSLALTAPIHPVPAVDARDLGAPREPLAEALVAALQGRDAARYRVVMRDGPALEGRTCGHVETDHGVYLFPPADGGGVQRLFVPREAWSSFESGPRIGLLLQDQQAATAHDVEAAAGEQQRLRAQKLGDILLLQQVITPQALAAAIDKQTKMPMVRIGEALISLGLITPEQLDEALARQKEDRSIPLGELLVRSGTVSRQDLQTALARKMGYPLVDLKKFPCEVLAIKAVPYAMASRVKAMPLMMLGNRLVVALEDPTQPAVIDELEFVTQVKVVPVLTVFGSVGPTLRDAYERAGVAQGASPHDASAGVEYESEDTDMLMASLEREGIDRSDDDSQIEQSDNSLVRLINKMIAEAVSQGASDIHVESYPGREKIRVRFRRDGTLQPYLELPHTYRNAMIARIKIMCDLDISERRKPQDGKINFAKFSPQHRVELRVATIPTNGGLEDVVLRILSSARPLPVSALELSPRNMASTLQAVERPYGLILCVGPTGSGKTTTLHSLLAHINKPERKIWTAEDPVEITQAGLRQVQINPKIDWTFARALRAFLRADPDVIMVGEIRDAETGGIAIEASLTGHLVMSTLHTNSAPETVTRLLDMGMDPFNFADSLLMVVAQRLVRRLCKPCRQSRPATETEVEELLADHLHPLPKDEPRFSREAVLADWTARFGQDGRLLRYTSVGCPACGGTGLKGRAGLHELMTVTREVRRLIQNGARSEELQTQAFRDGMMSLRQDGLEKVWQGVTTIDEVRAMSNV